LIDKVRDIVGLYVNPPEHAVVLCVDEKSQSQALDRTQPLLPMRPGQVERRTYDYERHGTTSLFAALETKTGQVIGRFHRRHRSVDFRKFLDVIETEVPRGLDIHLIIDNYGTHKTPLIRNWLTKRPRFHVHRSAISSRLNAHVFTGARMFTLRLVNSCHCLGTAGSVPFPSTMKNPTTFRCTAISNAQSICRSI
jgi:hypothetical protein